MWEYGYCPEFGLTQENYTDTGFITRAKRAKDWGFCSPLCDSQSLSEHLMETKLDILTPEECNKFNSATLVYRDDAEICAGNKIMYPTIKVYIRKKLRKPRNGKKYVFIYSEDRKNTVRPSHSFYKYGIFLLPCFQFSSVRNPNKPTWSIILVVQIRALGIQEDLFSSS